MEKSLIIIPFDIDITNYFDSDVYQHAKETLFRIPDAINHIFIYQSKDNFTLQLKKCIELTKEITILKMFVVSHATLTTMGNDDNKQMDAKELSSYLKTIVQGLITTVKGIQKCLIYLFGCQTGKKLIHQIGPNLIGSSFIELYGIDGFIGQIKNKKHIYVSCLLGGPARYRYQQRLVKFIL